MAGGAKPGERRGGKKLGSRNKATIERLTREEIADQVRAEIIAANKAKTDETRKRAKDVMEEFLPILRGYAAYYQPTFAGMPTQNPNGNEVKFREWFVVLLDLAKTLAPFQSPTYRAIVVSAPDVPLAPAAPKLIGSNVVSINDPALMTRAYQRMLKASSQ